MELMIWSGNPNRLGGLPSRGIASRAETGFRAVPRQVRATNQSTKEENAMKLIKQGLVKRRHILAVIAGAITAALSGAAQTVPQPGLSIAATGTNQFTIVITNGVSYANYELLHTPVIDSVVYPWEILAEGTIGQTNFIVGADAMLLGFYRVDCSTDWDGDGVPNWADGNPYDPLVGRLTITIDSPAPNGVFY